MIDLKQPKISAEGLNKRGYRALLSGEQFDSFFTTIDCGNKVFSNYKKWVKDYKNQTSEIAKVLKGCSLEETVDRIHWFLYNHIQYNTVLPDFLLKTPACAWLSRKEGADCKTYATFASSILLNLNIQHYLRSVTEPEGNHIYVVIPIKQDGTKLGEAAIYGIDYLIIDGARKVNKPKPYLLKRYDIYKSR